MSFKLSFEIFLLFIQNIIAHPLDVTYHKNLHLLDHNSCGPIKEEKIYGGDKTGIFEYPWMALLEYERVEKDKIYSKFRCAGSIINKRYILTSAHCVKNRTLEIADEILTTVRVGVHNLITKSDCDKDMDNPEFVCAEKYQDIRVERIHLHPQYLKYFEPNDIALLRLEKDIDFRPRNVKPICLPIGSAAHLTQKMLSVTGWGLTEKGNSSGDLLLVHLPLFPIEECNKIYKKRNLKINYKQICAGGKKGFDSCSGDSGGPLQSPGIYNNDVKFIQYGIVSFGYGCGSVGIPGVYTNVSIFMDWILDTIEE